MKIFQFIDLFFLFAIFISGCSSEAALYENNSTVAVFMTIPNGDIVIENITKHRDLQPDDEIILPVAGEMVSAKFINFFSRILSEDGAEVLRGISGDFSSGEKEKINNRQLRKLLAKFERE